MQNVNCEFTLAPMSDRFVEIILDAVGKVDVSGLSAKTGRMSTVYSGELGRVAGALYQCFAAARRPGVHMTMQAVFTGEKSPLEETVPASMENGENCLCDLEIYRPEGAGLDFPDDVELEVRPTAYGAQIEGRTDHVFATLVQTVSTAARQGEFVVSAAFSVNSPTPKEGSRA